ncbi:hypothetical protein [uncultured Methanobrevibacter sp.]|uniref:hypothetical protein n=1 Tax=uncultured Methanobrevibacter sp. TaxID=253161 RepID=UPI0025F2D8A0|nr:hypothetical protein [uncultured Methanobrevibacter sp.]
MAERYQWTQGPYNGQIEVVNCEDETCVYFDSGRRCSKEMMQYMMFQISDSEDNNYFSGSLNTFEDEIQNGSGKDYSGNIDVNIDIEQIKDSITQENIQQKQTVITNNTSSSATVKREEDISPILKLLNMQKEDSLKKIENNLTISLNWPSDDFVKILINTFDKNMVVSELTSYMEKQINFDNIKENIKTLITEEINKLCE